MIPSVLLTSVLFTAPKIGDTAPDFTISDTAGLSHQLSKMVREGPVILAFFPKAFTGG